MEDEELEQIKKKKLAEMMKRQDEIAKEKENQIIELTDDNFDRVIASNIPTLVDFWAEWCGPCQFMLPVFSRLAKKYKNIRFARANVDQAQSVAARNGVYAIPTFIMFKNGRVVDKAVGAVGEPGLHMLAQKYSK